MKPLMKMRTQHQGFTIVELLIVIVIIAILAAITMVAYNGIQDKASDAAADSDLANSDKIIRNHQVINGTLPASLSEFRADGANRIADKMVSDYHTAKVGEYVASFRDDGSYISIKYWNYTKKQWDERSWWINDDTGAIEIEDGTACWSEKLTDCMGDTYDT